MPAVVELEGHPINVRTGLWCGLCHLPSVAEADIVIVSRRTLRVVARKTASICTEHQ